MEILPIECSCISPASINHLVDLVIDMVRGQMIIPDQLLHKRNSERGAILNYNMFNNRY